MGLGLHSGQAAEIHQAEMNRYMNDFNYQL